MTEDILHETAERWKPIEGATSYEVSDHGQVRSYKVHRSATKRRVIPRLIRPRVTKRGAGYRSVALVADDGTKRHLRVGRLVAAAFVPNPDNKPQVNHIDGNKLNDFWLNLEWSSASENVQHAHDSGLCHPANGETHYKAKLSDANVVEIRQRYWCPCILVYGRKRTNCTHGNTITQLAEEFDVSFQEIHCVINGKVRKHAVD